MHTRWRRLPLALLGGLVMLSGCGGPAAVSAPAGKPNVVLIIIDALRADKLGCYGASEDASPELDSLACDGLRFSRVVAQCSWTRPSIASIVSSRYPRSIGMYLERDQALDGRFDTLAERLEASGYKTIGATSNPHLNSVFNFHQGFDVYLDSNVVYTFMGPAGDQRPFKSTKVKSAADMFETILELADESSDGPRYVQMLVMEVHEWCRKANALTRDEFRGRFRGRPYSLYLDALRQVSYDIGAFVQQLVAKPGWENTLFIITSDHGEGLGDHPGVEKSHYHGRLLYESQLMVPLIFYHHGRRFPIQQIDRPVRLLDLVPTVLDYVGVSVPEGLDGVSVMPWVRGEEAPVDLPDYFIAETKLRGHNKIAVYSPDWKYIENRDGHKGVNPRELQRVGVRENGRKTDQIAEHAATAGAMQACLRDWEQKHPEAAPSPCVKPLSQEEIDQFKAVGYLE